MDNLTQLTDRQKEILLKQLQDRLSKIASQQEDLWNEEKEIQSLIKGVNAQSTAGNTSLKKRQSLLKDQDFNWKSISIEILRDKGRFLSTDDVFMEFLNLKPTFKDVAKKNIQASFSSALTKLSEDGEAVKIIRTYGKGSYWGLPNWFDIDGLPLPGFKEQLITKGIVDFRYQRTKPHPPNEAVVLNLTLTALDDATGKMET